jgi:hypothetical protein
MKHLLTGVAMAAALAIAAPVWAQAPSGGNPTGTSGPNPGGPGLTPYSGSAPRPAAAPPTPAPPASMSDTHSAAPPRHRHARAHHATHNRMARHQRGGVPEGTGGDIANQLNQQELGRAQAGNFTSQPGGPPSAAVPSGPAPSSRMPGPKSAGSGYIQAQPGAGTATPQPSPRTIGPGQGATR